MINETLAALYELLQVNEKRNFCPRPGIYKVISTYQGSCYDKPAFKAKCNWRTTLSNAYQKDFVVTIQLESFKNNASHEQLEILNSDSFLGREINVFVAEQDEYTKKLRLEWKFVKLPTLDFNTLNKRIASGNIDPFSIDQTDNFDAEEGDDLIPEI